jgi:hypothetical protein
MHMDDQENISPARAYIRPPAAPRQLERELFETLVVEGVGSHAEDHTHKNAASATDN